MRSLAWFLAVVGLALGFASPALAQPGDDPIQSVAPVDGVVLPVSAGGIEVRYTCPSYRVAGEGLFSTPGSRQDYGVRFATTPALGNDGRLLQSNLVALAGPDLVQDNDIPVGQCRGFMLDPDAKPQSRPGTYYWQASRICVDCSGGYESGPVRSFRLTAAGSGVKLGLGAPGTVYRGYAFVVDLRTKGLPNGTRVALQLRRGGRLKTFDRSRSVGSSSTLAVRLPRRSRPGAYRLRATARVGSETVVSATRRLKLRPDRRRTTSGRQDGRWVGRSGRLPVRFGVARRGREIRAGRFRVALLCPTPGFVNPFTIQLADAPVPRAPVAPDGSFVFAGVVRGSAALVSGRLRGRRASGRAELSLGTCTGGGRVSARRR